MAVSGERIVPPIIAAMPMSAHSPLSPTGMNFAEAAPSASHHQQRCKHAAGCSRTECERPNKRLSDQNTEEGRADDVSSQQLMDRIVSNPEYAGLNDSTDTDKQTTNRRPPHPVKRQFREKIFEGVHQRGQKTRTETCQNTHQKHKTHTL